MNKRGLVRGIRKQIKNVLLMFLCCCVMFFLVNNYYDECYLRLLPSRNHFNECAREGQTAHEKLNINVTGDINRLIATDIAKLNRLILSDRRVNISTVRKVKKFMSLPEIVTITEFPLDELFDQRKSEADTQCKEIEKKEIVNAAKGNNLSSKAANAELRNFELSVGYSGSGPTRRKKKAMYGRNAIEFYKLNEQKLNFLKKYYIPQRQPKIFETLVKKNRWIHFHRIVESPLGPSQNKVVEINWCPIFKAASTPWLAVFTKLSKALTNKTEAQIQRGKLGFMELARTYRLLTPTIYDKAVHPIKYSMVVVRHPFKRLLSGYRDKIERVKGRLYYYNKYSTSIITKFRKSNSGSLERITKDKDFKLKVPTFREFVQFVLSVQPKKLDEHWRPMYLDCNPCLQKFDFILKVETLNVDKDKVLQYLHVSSSDHQFKEIEDVWLRWNNPSGTNQRRNESYYYSQLSVEDMEKLYKLYEIDFKIFDYSPESYYLMGKDV